MERIECEKGEGSERLDVNVIKDVDTDASLNQDAASHHRMHIVDDLLFLEEAKLRELGFTKDYISVISRLCNAAKKMVVINRHLVASRMMHRILLSKRDLLQIGYEELKSRVIEAEKKGVSAEEELEGMESLFGIRLALSEKLRVEANKMAEEEGKLCEIASQVTKLEFMMEFKSGEQKKWNVDAETEACEAALAGRGPNWMDIVRSASKKMERESMTSNSA